ncbi:MAG: putative rhamnosyl transferase [Microlunatus sp.]|nr:putative rhamnosyl transferase [Microlunatus sp.]
MTRNASATGSAIDHVLLTRFNLPSRGAESLIRAQDGWLRDRVALFERHTVPSVREQTVIDVRWIVYLDPESPTWLADRLRPHVENGTFVPLYRESVEWSDVVIDARQLTGARGNVLVTTNLDNDDALAIDFVERVQQQARAGWHGAIYLGTGLIQYGDRVYLRQDPDNAFCSVAEPWAGALTAWRDWHVLLGTHMPTTTISGAPAWLQVVHGRNVSNRIRGRLTDPESYSALFPAQMEGLTRPNQFALRADRYLYGPGRATRELASRLVKNTILALAGKGGIERLSASLAAFRRRARLVRRSSR